MVPGEIDKPESFLTSKRYPRQQNICGQSLFIPTLGITTKYFKADKFT